MRRFFLPPHLALVSVWMLACGGQNTALPAPKTEPTSAAAVTSATTADAKTPGLQSDTSAAGTSPACAAVAKAQAEGAAVAKSLTDVLDPMSATFSIPESATTIFTKCFPTKSGAWGLVLRDVAKSKGGLSGKVVALHATADGKTAEAPLADRSRKDGAPLAFQFDDAQKVHWDRARTSDLDDDGEEELVVTGRVQLANTPARPFGQVLAAPGGSVGRYRAAERLEFFDAADVDRDGKIDLLLHAPYRDAVKDACDGTSAVVEGPVLVAHTLKDGSFSTNDAVALAQAREACFEKPAEIVSRIEETREVDALQTAMNVACARLWGVPEAVVMSAIARDCRPMRAGEACDPSSLTTCRQADLLRSWARRTPPLSIR